MQSQQNPSGQKLQWWQEEKTTAPKWYQEPVVTGEQQTRSVEDTVPVTTPVPLDLWEELEAEAVRRSEMEAQAELITGDLATPQRKRMRLVNGILASFTLLYLGLGFLLHHWVFFILPVFFILEAILLNWVTRRVVQGPKPSISLSPLGMSVAMPQFQVGPVFWEEIESVQPKSFLGMQYLRVRLKDKKSTMERALSMRTPGLKRFNIWLLRFSDWEIMTAAFPISHKQIAAKIAAIRPDLVKK